MRHWHKSATFSDSFRHAWSGFVLAVSLENNVKRQLFLGIAAFAVAALLRLPLTHVLILLLVSALVVSLELINTALEQLADAFHPEYNHAIKQAKDVTAAAVLVASAAAFIIGILIFLPPLTNLVT